VIAQATPQVVREKTRQLISVWKPGARFVLNAGCAIPPSAPPENIFALLETAHAEGAYI
jgi:uroporphyrinogen decarboxylase